MPLEQIAAVGDNRNDIDMIAVAGLGVAVDDGHPDVRAAADVVVGACADGAVAELALSS
ncbi:HAD family hydrolase [Microbispora siamensis]